MNDANAKRSHCGSQGLLFMEVAETGIPVRIPSGGRTVSIDAKRRRLLLAAAASGVLSSGHARAQAWPARPIRIICPFPPGGLTDLYSRAIGEHLQANLGQPVLIENRPGAGGIIGNDLVAKAAPDGYTFLVTIQTSLVQGQ